MRDRLHRVWQLFLLLFNSVEVYVKRQSAQHRRKNKNCERSHPTEATKKDLTQRGTARFGSFLPCQVPRVAWIAVLFLIVLAIPATNRAQTQQRTKSTDSAPVPEPAIPAILAAFEKYDVVAMPEDHGLKDLDDLIFALVRNPAFSGKVNDVVVECGNSLYQPLLDRYIAGEDVPLTEARKVWRNTTQPICGGWGSGFFEQLYPLLRAINQKLPREKRLRVLAPDPPIDWNQIKSGDDFMKFAHRDQSIASVMEKEVLSKHHKALMLCGTFHLIHLNDVRASAVSMYEKDYPNVTFVISELIAADAQASAAFTDWPNPSIARSKGTWVGALDIGHFLPPPTRIDQDCNVHNDFPKHLQKPMEDLVDAFLYLGPKELALKEEFPAYIVLDTEYMAEVRRREGGSRTVKEFNQQFVDDAEDPLFTLPKPPGPKDVQANVQSCLDRKSRSNTPQ